MCDVTVKVTWPSWQAGGDEYIAQPSPWKPMEVCSQRGPVRPSGHSHLSAKGVPGRKVVISKVAFKVGHDSIPGRTVVISLFAYKIKFLCSLVYGPLFVHSLRLNFSAMLGANL